MHVWECMCVYVLGVVHVGVCACVLMYWGVVHVGVYVCLCIGGCACGSVCMCAYVLGVCACGSVCAYVLGGCVCGSVLMYWEVVHVGVYVYMCVKVNKSTGPVLFTHSIQEMGLLLSCLYKHTCMRPV